MGIVIDSDFRAWNFDASYFDPRLFFHRTTVGFTIVLPVVGYLAFASDSPTLMFDLKNRLSSTYDVKLYGPLQIFLDGLLFAIKQEFMSSKHNTLHAFSLVSGCPVVNLFLHQFVVSMIDFPQLPYLRLHIHSFDLLSVPLHSY